MRNARKYEGQYPLSITRRLSHAATSLSVPINLALLTANLRFSLDVGTIRSPYYFSPWLAKGGLK